MSGNPEGAVKTAAKRRGMDVSTYKALVASGEHWCTGCKAWHDIGAFAKDRSRGNGLTASCRAYRNKPITKPAFKKERKERPPISEETRAKMRASAILRGASNRLGSKHSAETRAKISHATRARTAKGSNHYAWKGGITETQRRDRKSPGYKTWRREVRERAGDACEMCQSNHGANRMHAHHLRGFASHPELRLDPANGAWLCDDCHSAVHAMNLPVVQP